MFTSEIVIAYKYIKYINNVARVYWLNKKWCQIGPITVLWLYVRFE